MNKAASFTKGDPGAASKDRPPWIFKDSTKCASQTRLLLPFTAQIQAGRLRDNVKVENEDKGAEGGTWGSQSASKGKRGIILSLSTWWHAWCYHVCILLSSILRWIFHLFHGHTMHQLAVRGFSAFAKNPKQIKRCNISQLLFPE